MTITQMYWLITLPKIGSGLGQFLFVFGLLAAICYLISVLVFSDIGFNFFKKWIFILIILLTTLGGLLMVFIPSSKEILAIYGINYLTNNESLQKIPPKLFEYANIKLDDLLKEDHANN